ncbi:MAG: hypothetical protein SF097_23425 [Acidobacteriota bacterium]|nr:hypothetical protein [Acidobacteriota bacterium]
MVRKFAASLFISALTLTPVLAQKETTKEKEVVEKAKQEKVAGKKATEKSQNLSPSEKMSKKPLPRPTPPAGNNGGMKDNNGMGPGGMKPGDKGNGGAGDIQLGAEVMILNVMKNDANAKPNPNGAGRLVPVKVEWKVKLSPGAKLMELEAMLSTTNTDNSMTKVSKMLSLAANSETIMLPMPEGVFAKDFVLKINAKCATASGRTVSSTETKTGMFRVAGK